MSYVAPHSKPSAGKPGYEEASEAKIHRIRITLTSRNVKSLEKGTPPLPSIRQIRHA